MENAKIKKSNCDVLRNFQTMWASRNVYFVVNYQNAQKLKNIMYIVEVWPSVTEDNLRFV